MKMYRPVDKVRFGTLPQASPFRYSEPKDGEECIMCGPSRLRSREHTSCYMQVPMEEFEQ